MIRKFTIILWVLVLVAAAWWVYNNQQNSSPALIDEQHDGRAFAEIPWKHLPAVRPFKMTERSGEKFDSRSLAGKPYVVSFFFSTCPTICQDLNRQIQRLANRFKDQELTFVSISVDPKTDTPDVLKEYAAGFQADKYRWLMLSGQMYKVREIGEKQFNVVVDGINHTSDIMLVDRWGRFRDRFTWDDGKEMQRFVQVAKQVLDESQPPLDKVIKTRNVLAGIDHQTSPVKWLNEFYLTDSNEKRFHSRDLTGSAWIASFFFTSCPGVCPRQNKFLVDLLPEIHSRQASLVSITSDPQTDDPAKLRQYARQIGARGDWTFLTGDKNYIRRVGSEFLGIMGDGGHHSSLLVVVDRWGNVRGRFDWQKAGEKQRMLELIDLINLEQVPNVDFQLMTSETDE